MANKVMKKAQKGGAIKRAPQMNRHEKMMQDSYKPAPKRNFDIERQLRDTYKPAYDKAAADSVRKKAIESLAKPKKSMYDAPSFAPTGPRPKKKNGGTMSKSKKK